jgi:hypothetical protein
MILALIAMAANQPAVPNLYSSETTELIRSYGWCLENTAMSLPEARSDISVAFETAKVRCADIREKASQSFARDQSSWPWTAPERAQASAQKFLTQIETIARSRAAEAVKPSPPGK